MKILRPGGFLLVKRSLETVTIFFFAAFDDRDASVCETAAVKTIFFVKSSMIHLQKKSFSPAASYATEILTTLLSSDSTHGP